MMWILLTGTALASDEAALPTWPIDNGWSSVIGATLLWVILRSHSWAAWLQQLLRSAAIALSLLSLGWFLGETNRQWLMLSLIVGIGWSVKDLAADVFSSIMLRMEGKMQGYILVDGFSGVVQKRGWRSVTLISEKGAPVIVPSRLLLWRPVQHFPIGQHPVTFQFWLPEGIDFEQASKIISISLDAIPWLTEAYAKIEPAKNSPRALTVEMRLMRIGDREKVQRWIGECLRSEAQST